MASGEGLALVNLLACQTTRLHFPGPPGCNADLLGSSLMPTDEFHRDLKVQGCFTPSRHEGRELRPTALRDFFGYSAGPPPSAKLLAIIMSALSL